MWQVYHTTKIDLKMLFAFVIRHPTNINGKMKFIRGFENAGNGLVLTKWFAIPL